MLCAASRSAFTSGDVLDETVAPAWAQNASHFGHHLPRIRYRAKYQARDHGVCAVIGQVDALTDDVTNFKVDTPLVGGQAQRTMHVGFGSTAMSLLPGFR
jgi:hypothetical protein